MFDTWIRREAILRFVPLHGNPEDRITVMLEAYNDAGVFLRFTADKSQSFIPYSEVLTLDLQEYTKEEEKEPEAVTPDRTRPETPARPNRTVS